MPVPVVAWVIVVSLLLTGTHPHGNPIKCSAFAVLIPRNDINWLNRRYETHSNSLAGSYIEIYAVPWAESRVTSDRCARCRAGTADLRLDCRKADRLPFFMEVALGVARADQARHWRGRETCRLSERGSASTHERHRQAAWRHPGSGGRAVRQPKVPAAQCRETRRIMYRALSISHLPF